MILKTDPRSVLGVGPDASQNDIKMAYRRLALKNHPDMPEGSREVFEAIQAAYEKLQASTSLAPETHVVNGRGPDERLWSFARHMAEASRKVGISNSNPKVAFDAWVDLRDVLTGVKLVLKYRNVTRSVFVPAGVEDGERFTLPDAYEAGEQKFDFRVVVHVRLGEGIERKGADLHAVTRLSVFDMMAGCSRQTEWIGGEEMLLEIPSGSAPLTIVRVAGKGLPRRNDGGRGNAFITVQATYPKSVDGEEIAMLQDLARRHRSRAS